MFLLLTPINEKKKNPKADSPIGAIRLNNLPVYEIHDFYCKMFFILCIDLSLQNIFLFTDWIFWQFGIEDVLKIGQWLDLEILMDWLFSLSL